jgi:sulfatase modifying factor 1
VKRTAASAAAFLLIGCTAPPRDGAPTGRALASFAVEAPQAEAPDPTVAEGSVTGERARTACRPEMAEIAGNGREATFCVDRWEASLVEAVGGVERAVSPFSPVDGRRVRAISAAGVFPQGYVSALQARDACAASGKRLCTLREWRKACRGPDGRTFGYGGRREPGRCNDNGRNPVLALFGRGRWTWATMNYPELNRLPRTLDRTGSHAGCTNGYGVFDMVGNLHEWVADASGTFSGGYYQDVASPGHGEGCGYVTTAHEARYHDYSTGFRCCADVR